MVGLFREGVSQALSLALAAHCKFFKSEVLISGIPNDFRTLFVWESCGFEGSSTVIWPEESLITILFFGKSRSSCGKCITGGNKILAAAIIPEDLYKNLVVMPF